MTVVLAAPVALLAACASGMTPLQERSYSAFKDCQSVAPTAQITEIREDGNIRYSAQPGDINRMRQCLEQRYGFKFQ